MNGFGSEGQGGENWKKGEQKAGLNRRIVAATLAILLKMSGPTAAEAGMRRALRQTERAS